MSQLTEEQHRILVAVADGRMIRDERSRYQIPGETRPDRKARESLCGRGLIVPMYGRTAYILTDAGNAALRRAEHDRISARGGWIG